MVKKEKVFCENCKWCCYDGSFECRNKKTAHKKADSFLKKGGDVEFYESCYLLNSKNDCKYFEKKDFHYYLFLQFMYYKTVWFCFLGLLFVCSAWLFSWIYGLENWVKK